MDRAAWRAQPAAAALACRRRLRLRRSRARSAPAPGSSPTDGDATLDGPLALGSAPSGRSSSSFPARWRLRGTVAVHGVVVAGSLEWAQRRARRRRDRPRRGPWSKAATTATPPPTSCATRRCSLARSARPG
jgi:hypothetical protein